MNVLPEAYLSLFKGNPVLSYDSDIYGLIFLYIHAQLYY